MNIMDMLLTFPYLLPLDQRRCHYKGFIQVQNETFHLEIRLADSTQINPAFLSCEWKLKELLQDYQEILLQRLKQSASLSDFLKELQRLLEIQLEKRHRNGITANPTPKLYTQLVAEIEQMGWHRLVFIDSSFQQLHLVTEDCEKRQHVLKVFLQNEHPYVCPKTVCDLPKAVDFTWTPQSRLVDLLNQFNHSLEKYQQFWNNLDVVDQKTWVLEPEKPGRADCVRRIALGNNASLQMTVSALHPQMLPECRFLGAENVINPLKTKLNSNLHLWDADQLLLDNLQKVLEIEFPSPTKSSKEDITMECGICYAYRLEQEIPDQACDDPRCGQSFHYSCLYEWLRSLPSFRQSFNVAFGECPFCSTPITVKIHAR